MIQTMMATEPRQGGPDPLGDNYASHNLMDVDGNVIDPLTDDVLLMRHMFGFTGQALVEDARAEYPQEQIEKRGLSGDNNG